MKLKLIAIDIDGTLLNDASRKNNCIARVTSKNIAMIKKAEALGIKIVLTTGRPLKGAQQYINLLNLANHSNEYVITFNGSCIQTTDNQILYHQHLSKNDLKVVASLVKIFPIGTFIQTPQSLYSPIKQINSYGKYESKKNNLPITVKSWKYITENIDTVQPMKILFLDDKAKLDYFNNQITDEIKQKFNVMRTEDYSLDFLNKNADKGIALKILANHLHISSSDIMAIGNADNDIGMIKYAGVGVAVKNSTPSLLKVANEVTTSNNDNGVANAIEKYLS